MRRVGGDRGQAVVEFALALPLVLVLIFGIGVMCLLFYFMLQSR